MTWFRILLLTGASVHALKISDDDKCACLAWKDAYEHHNASCGSGREFDWITTEPGMGVAAAKHPAFEFEFCNMWWRNIPAGFKHCADSKFGKGHGVPWCYVSEECASGTRQAPGFTKTKTCETGKDEILGDMRVDDLAQRLRELNLEIGLVVHFAYEAWDGEEKLPDLQEFFGLPKGDDKAKPLTDELRAKLQQKMDAGKPVFLDSRNGHPPFAVLEGKKLWWINFSNKYKDEKDKWEHKGEMNDVKCVAGCETVSPIW